jgi:hypothetical protein
MDEAGKEGGDVGGGGCNHTQNGGLAHGLPKGTRAHGWQSQEPHARYRWSEGTWPAMSAPEVPGQRCWRQMHCHFPASTRWPRTTTIVTSQPPSQPPFTRERRVKDGEGATTERGPREVHTPVGSTQSGQRSKPHCWPWRRPLRTRSPRDDPLAPQTPVRTRTALGSQQ